MITFFSAPKAFAGHIGLIQDNALSSWAALGSDVEVLLVGDEEGVQEAAARHGFGHVGAIAENEYGTPLVSDIFARAEAAASHDLLCYINADIITLSDFLPALDRITFTKYLMLGQRIDLDVTERIDFGSPNWEEDLRKVALRDGELHPKVGVDYYVYTRGLWRDMPAFAVGRTVYDQWLIWDALRSGTPVIDATSVVTSVHQNHERTYASLGRESPDEQTELHRGIEAQRNRRMLGGRERTRTLHHANWVLEPSGLRRSRSIERLYHVTRSFAKTQVCRTARLVGWEAMGY